jgi:hypothetical protein
MNSSFRFRSPSIVSLLVDNVDIRLSVYFDQSIYLPDVAQLDYIADLLLNVSSSSVPTLPYTGEELRLQVANVTRAASMDDVELFVGCALCPLTMLSAQGVACQPPMQLPVGERLLLNNEQRPGPCSLATRSRWSSWSRDFVCDSF